MKLAFAVFVTDAIFQAWRERVVFGLRAVLGSRAHARALPGEVYLEEPLVREVDAVAHAASHDAVDQASTRERIAVQRERGLDARPKSRPARFYRCTTLVSRQRLHAERISQAR